MANKLHVAIIDDHRLFRNALSSVISSFGYEVSMQCNNGKHFIDHLDEEHLPDIILMDIKMPEMDGIETTLWLKNNYPSIPVLALTIYDDDNLVKKIIESGAKGFVSKAAGPSEIKSAIKNIIRKDLPRTLKTENLLEKFRKLFS